MGNAQKIGKENGNQLIFSDNFLRKEYSELFEDNVEKVISLQENLLKLNKNIELKKTQIEFSNQELKLNEENFFILKDYKQKRPDLFDGFKGGLFMILAILLLLSDYFILGQVLSKVLGEKFITSSGVHFTLSVFTLTACILTMGMIIKIFLDRDLFENKLFGKIITYAAIVAFFIILGTALVRLFIPLNVGEGASVSKTLDIANRILSMILGVSLPIIGAIYFIYSYILIKNSLLFKRTFKTINKVNKTIIDLKKKIIADETDLTVNNEKLKHNSTILDNKKQKLKSDYFRGVEEGLLSAFASEDYIEILKKAIVREKIHNYNARKF